MQCQTGYKRLHAYISLVNYFIDVIRMVDLKGSGFGGSTKHIFIMIDFAILFDTSAIVNYGRLT